MIGKRESENRKFSEKKKKERKQEKKTGKNRETPLISSDVLIRINDSCNCLKSQ